ncbi:hypothetical protein C1645_783783 [Glomus cerebriforme]|uniref:Protein kinase domain-containing protein n=1 Tax=Glomus cerebriforme TaxID=658196 RepID=A0A397SEC5_9GLOM|nr:hypothetical protein C1645_783783 [Glomus cerebriforme]
MIMWELITGRRPFCDKSHDTDLIIEICDGLRPPIVKHAPEGYVELMEECWRFDPKERPTATELHTKVGTIYDNERNKPTKIIESPDIGPIITNHPGAIYKSRPLSTMIKSAESMKRLGGQSILSKFGKRKFNDNNFIENNEDKIIKKVKLFEKENDNGKYFITLILNTNILCSVKVG